MYTGTYIDNAFVKIDFQLMLNYKMKNQFTTLRYCLGTIFLSCQSLIYDIKLIFFKSDEITKIIIPNYYQTVEN